MKDPYINHRAALAPLISGHTPPTTEDTLGETFIDFVIQQGLGPLWDHAISTKRFSPPISDHARERLHHSRLSATGEYLIQRNSLDTIKSNLDDADIPHAVFKGCHTRECFFEEPALRPAVDIDVLVPDELKVDVIRAFKSEGFSFHGKPENISHECSLIKGKTSIDLHWDILRPGRTRIPMATKMLENRKDFGSHWGLSDNATLFILLVHSVFTKYLTTPHATLVRQLDLAYLLEKGDLDWPMVIHRLELSGMKTTAWLSLTWLALLTDIRAPGDTEKILEPGRARQHYLNQWLKRNLSERWLTKPSIVQLGLTLAVHDTWADVFRATRSVSRSRSTGAETLSAMQ